MKDSDFRVEVTSLEELSRRIVLFLEQLSSIRYFKYQKRMVTAIVKALLFEQTEVVIFGARQVGKTACVGSSLTGLLILLPLLASRKEIVERFPVFKKWENGFWIGMFAPQYEQGYTTFDYVVKGLKLQNTRFILEDTAINSETEANEIILSNGSLLRLKSAHPSVKLESKTYHMIVLEEAQALDKDRVQRTLLPMVAFWNGTVVKVGVASFDKSTDFYESVTRMEKRKSPYFVAVPAVEAGKENKQYRKFVETERRKHGADNPFIGVNYDMKWDFSGRALSEVKIESCMNSNIDWEDTFRGEGVIVGVDIGKVSDNTAVCIGHMLNVDERMEKPRIRLLACEIFSGDYELQYAEIVRLLQKFNPAVVAVDGTSYGAAFVDRLTWALPGASVLGVVFNQFTKSELSLLLLDAFQFRLIEIPGKGNARKRTVWKKLYFELSMLSKTVTGGRLVVEGSEGAHDDIPYALALMLKGAEQLVGYGAVEVRRYAR